MGSRRSKSSGLEDLYRFFVEVPFWAGPLLAGLAFAGLYWLAPVLFDPEKTTNAVAKNAWPILGGAARKVAPWSAGLILFVWSIAELRKFSNRKLLDNTLGKAGIRNLNWQDFERLLAEAFRRQGYTVEHIGQSGPDGGIDLRIHLA